MNEYRFDEISVGQTEQFEITITEELLDIFRAMTGDVNPLHQDDAFAKEHGYEGRVSFGMLTASFLSTLAGVYLPGRNSLIQSVDIKFSKPVYPGEKLTMKGTVTEKNETFRFLKVKAEGRNEAEEKKIKAVMQIGVME